MYNYYKLLDHVIICKPLDYITSGWIAVQPGYGFDFNMDKYSLNIKTNSTLGSNDKVDMRFYTNVPPVIVEVSPYLPF